MVERKLPKLEVAGSNPVVRFFGRHEPRRCLAGHAKSRRAAKFIVVNDFCTVATDGVLAHARVLAHSLRTTNPNSRCFLLSIEGTDGLLHTDHELFEVLTIDDLGLPQLWRLAEMYSGFELAVALKPFLCRHLLKTSSQVVYLDADIRVYASLANIFEQLEADQILLTPHILSALPRDSMGPSDLDIIKAGIFNTGFIGFGRGEQALQMLDWWCEHTVDKQPNGPNGGATNDQIWASLVPSLFSAAQILRDPGLNAAYWNLHERPLAQHDDSFFVGSERLRFFHFSGFSPDDPAILSKHSNRFSVLENKALAALCAQYAQELEKAGYFNRSRKPYRWSHSPGGIEMSAPNLPYFRSTQDSAPNCSVLFEDGEQAWLEWLGSPAREAEGGAHGVSNILAKVWNDRPDLQAAFPDLAGDDGPRLLEWQASSGVLEDLPPRAVTQRLHTSGLRPAAAICSA